MRIALYSRTARREISKIRSMISDLNIENTEEGRAHFRNIVMTPGSEFFNIFSYARTQVDFFAESSCRDLFFHVQEHNFDLLEIKTILNDLNLYFLGFQFGNKFMKEKFMEIYQKENDIYSLDKWNSFEQMYPDTFISMYDMWLQARY